MNHALLLLAQAEPAEPTINATTIGLIVIALIYLSRWLWDYNRQRVEESDRHEPKANPPLHKEYITRTEVEKIETTLKEDLTKQAGARKKMHEEIADLQGDVKALKTQGENQSTQIQQVQASIKENTTLTAATGATLQQMNLQLQQLNTHLLSQAKKS